jgi:hypothetical protein
MLTPGKTFTAPAGHVIVDCGPTADVEVGGGDAVDVEPEDVTVTVKLQ